MRSISIIVLIAIFTVFGVTAEARGRQSGISVLIHTEKSVPRTGFKIKFVEMVEDSRCPEGTSCIWAGNAKVKIVLRGGRGASRSYELNSTTQPTVVNYEGYEIKLTALTPRPAANIRINPDKYMATFEVTRAKGK